MKRSAVVTLIFILILGLFGVSCREESSCFPECFSETPATPLETEGLEESAKHSQAPGGHPLYSESQRLLLEGSRAETSLFIIKGPSSGPTVLVIGGVHGNEPAGYLAADIIASWVVDRGTLLVIPRANVKAIAGNSRFSPGEFDLNRAFPGNSAGSVTGQLALAINSVMKEFRPDWVLDLHEAMHFERYRPGALGQTWIYPRISSSLPVVEEAMTLVNGSLDNKAHHFILRRGSPRGSTTEAAAKLGLDGLILETTQQLPLETRVEQQLKMVYSMLQVLGVNVY